MNPNQMPWYVALLEGECPNPDWKGCEQFADCPDCKGTGRVPLLDVREPCGKCQGTGRRLVGRTGTLADAVINKPLYGKCPPCHGLGWTPTKVFERWLGAGVSVGLDRIDILYSGKWHVAFQKGDAYSGDTVVEALLAALVDAITPLAVNAAEAEAWVEANIPAVV